MNESRKLVELKQAIQDGFARERALKGALKNLFDASKHHDPDDWDGEPAMVKAAQLLGEPPFNGPPR